MVYGIITIVVVLLIFNSYSSFSSQTRHFENLLNQINIELLQDKDNMILRLKKAEYLMQLQNYNSAAREYRYIIENQNLIRQIKKEILNVCELNIKFCEAPLPWSFTGPRDIPGNFIHNFWLDRLGGQRRLVAASLP